MVPKVAFPFVQWRTEVFEQQPVVVAWLLTLPVKDQERTSLAAAPLVLTIAGVASFPSVHWSIVVVVLDPVVRWLVAVVELDSLVSFCHRAQPPSAYSYFVIERPFQFIWSEAYSVHLLFSLSGFNFQISPSLKFIKQLILDGSLNSS